MIIGKEVLHNASVSKNATAYSSSIQFKQCTGVVGVELISSAGSITVTQQCSLDNQTWYDPQNASGTALGGVVSAQGVTAGLWITYNPILAPYMRFKIVEGNTAATTVTITLVFQEEGI